MAKMRAKMQAIPASLGLMLLAVVGGAQAQQVGMGMEDVPLRPSELKLLQRITAVDPAFRHGDRVKRYYRTHPTTKNRIPLRVEVIAPKSGGLFFGEFISYNMVIDEPAGLVTYDYDAGTANRGRGTVLVTPKEIIKTEYSCGISSCSTRVERNGRPMREGAQAQN
ncbi:MAG: hypothetical protein K2W84_06225 [Burkholderiales bacterium]|nr:hypothetical protein [Burkholderiales bacterium]